MTDDVRLRILVVEDEPANRALVRAILARSKLAPLVAAELLEAPSLREARLALANRRIDLVLLDVRLSDGSGLDLVRDIDAVADGHRPAVVIMSASVLPQERTSALRSGADAFVGKPYHPTQVIDTIMGLVDR